MTEWDLKLKKNEAEILLFLLDAIREDSKDLCDNLEVQESDFAQVNAKVQVACINLSVNEAIKAGGQ